MPKKIMTKKRAREWIKAIDKLIKEYNKDNYYPSRCPLCYISEEKGCQDCLWIIFEGRLCDDGQDLHLERTYKERIKRLNRWKRKLNKIING